MRCKGDEKSRTLFWRGLISEHDTKPYDHIIETSESLGNIKTCCETKITIFTDGSGGRRTKDKRLRRCGWAWVVPRRGSNKIATYGARGSLGGLQTVPRAELKAIQQCLANIKEHPHIKEVTIYSDCKMADNIHPRPS